MAEFNVCEVNEHDQSAQLTCRWLVAVARPSDRRVISIVLGAGLIAFLAGAMMMRGGPAVFPDSVVYLGVARSLSHGRGLTYPCAPGDLVTQFPPGYPAVIAATRVVGASPIAGARWVNAVCFGVICASAVWLAARASPPRFRVAWAVSAGVATVTSLALIIVTSAALSDSLFVAASVLTLVMLVRHFESGSRLTLLVAALSAALAFLARYVGASVVIAGVVSILLFGPMAFARRVRHAAVFAVLASAPSAVWTVVASRHGSLGGSGAQVHFPGSAQLDGGAAAAAHWFLPPLLSAHPLVWWLVTAALASSLLVALVVVLQSRFDRNAYPAFTTAAVFGIIYVITFFFVMSFYEAGLVLDERYLAPLFVPLVVVITGLIARGLEPHTGWRRSASAGVLLLGLIISVFVAGRALPIIMHANTGAHGYIDRGYASEEWRQSPTLAAVTRLASTTPIYSNADDAIYALTGRCTDGIPSSRSHDLVNAIPAFAADVAQMAKDIRAHNGRLVFFSQVNRPYQPTASELEKFLPLHVVQKTSDGTIFSLGSPQPVH